MERIPASTWGILIVASLFATFAMFPEFTVLYLARQDFWVAFLLAFGAVVPQILWTRLVMPIPASPGSLLRGVGAVLASLYFLLLTVIVGRAMVELMGTLFERTPEIVIGLPYLAVVIYAARSGLEVIARLAVLVFPVIVVSYLVILLFALPLADFGNLLPVLEQGWLSAIRAAFVTAAWASGFVLLGPWVDAEARRRSLSWKPLLLAFASLVVLVGMTSAILVAVFGQQVTSVTFGVFVLSRMVTFSHLLTRFISIAITPAFLGVFVMAALFLWGSGRAAADAFHLRDGRVLMLPLGFLSLLLVLGGFPTRTALQEFVRQTFPQLSLVLGMLVPLFSRLGQPGRARR